MNQKKILDVTAGSRMMHFDKNNPEVLFSDKRSERLIAKDSSSKNGFREIVVNPDVQADFTNLPFADESFYLIVFDPPHLKTLGDTSWLAKKYGKLDNKWKETIKEGFSECFRVLKKNGTLVFKWNESEVKLSEVLPLAPIAPVFGHTSGRQSKTIWLTFFKS